VPAKRTCLWPNDILPVYLFVAMSVVRTPIRTRWVEISLTWAMVSHRSHDTCWIRLACRVGVVVFGVFDIDGSLRLLPTWGFFSWHLLRISSKVVGLPIDHGLWKNSYVSFSYVVSHEILGYFFYHRLLCADRERHCRANYLFRIGIYMCECSMYPGVSVNQ